MAEIRFRDLSIWLKIAIVGSYVMLILNILVFLLGFIEGVMYY